MSKYSKEHWAELVDVYKNNGKTRVSAHEIGIIWADREIQSLRDQLTKSKAEASLLADLLTDDKSAKQGLKELRDQLEEAKTLIDAVEPNGSGGQIYIKHMDFDEWVERCDAL